jgi:hypothetical protein
LNAITFAGDGAAALGLGGVAGAQHHGDDHPDDRQHGDTEDAEGDEVADLAFFGLLLALALQLFAAIAGRGGGVLGLLAAHGLSPVDGWEPARWRAGSASEQAKACSATGRRTAERTMTGRTIGRPDGDRHEHRRAPRQRQAAEAEQTEPAAEPLLGGAQCASHGDAEAEGRGERGQARDQRPE